METNTEIERKFLVVSDGYKRAAERCVHIMQGYICRESGRTVRIRIEDSRAWITIKGRSTDDGLSRSEWEYGIPLDHAREMLRICDGKLIDKHRYIIPATADRYWEVDEFHGSNEGLVVAEIELGDQNEAFSRPDWLGEEVTGDRRYYNSVLSA